MEFIHGVLEWFIIVLIMPAGLLAGKLLPFRGIRCGFYVILLLAAFVLDLNKVTFRSDAANLVFYLLILLAFTEFFWFCVRKKSKLLLCGAFMGLVPVFLYVYAAALLLLPLPCHKNSGELVDEYKSCSFGAYKLTKRLSFDPFNPAQVYVLYRDIKNTPLKKQVDRFPSPKGYIEARFVPRWQCRGDGRAKVELYIDGYTLWGLEDKTDEEKQAKTEEEKALNSKKKAF
ncbi:MAG: hypothetical protein FWC23_03935 [Chitinispirillia bacterium]|nr:hypothetical protein [Chitinispirillia bacterium]MCL2268321.1 hypothetical protein [Chitinispirillia bacterium]